MNDLLLSASASHPDDNPRSAPGVNAPRGTGSSVTAGATAAGSTGVGAPWLAVTGFGFADAAGAAPRSPRTAGTPDGPPGGAPAEAPAGPFGGDPAGSPPGAPKGAGPGLPLGPSAQAPAGTPSPPGGVNGASDGVPARPPTMADVARLAGVSHQTVSRVLGDHPHVREETRAKVLRVIEETGYRRNSSARALATRRTRTLGVVASNTTLYGPASTRFALEEAARAEGYTVATVSLRTLTVDTLAEALDHLAEGGVEGAIALAPRRSAVEALAGLRCPFPVVAVGTGSGARVPNVNVDQRLGARLVTEHLLAAGHRTVWHLAGPEDWQEAADRVTGWRSALRDAGAEIPQPLYGDWSPLSGYRAGQELAGWVGRGLTAVFVANDQMALGVLRALREAGLRTPQDVAVAGFDDIPESEFFAPPLTTVRQDFATVGRRSIALLLDLIEGRAPAGAAAVPDASGTPDPGPDASGAADAPSGVPAVAVPPQLVVRASTAPD